MKRTLWLAHLQVYSGSSSRAQCDIPAWGAVPASFHGHPFGWTQPCCCPCWVPCCHLPLQCCLATRKPLHTLALSSGSSLGQPAWPNLTCFHCVLGKGEICLKKDRIMLPPFREHSIRLNFRKTPPGLLRLGKTCCFQWTAYIQLIITLYCQYRNI